MAKQQGIGNDVKAGKWRDNRGWRKGLARDVKNWSEDEVEKDSGRKSLNPKP